MNIRKTLLCTAIGTLLVAHASAFASSEDAADQADSGQQIKQLDEVIVTARKRAESIRDVPVAMSAITREQMDNGLVTDLTKVGEMVPQVSLSQSGSSTGAVITVRGVSTASNDAGLDQSVAIEFDGVPISRGEVISASMFDIDSVQVLQGPQALFFGKNSPAGVISLKSADPTDEFEGYVTLGREFETNQTYLEGAVSGALTPTLKARLAIRASDREGWMHNTAIARPDILNNTVTVPGATQGAWGPDDSIRAARLTLLWEPSDDFSANFKLMTNHQTRNSGNASTEPFCINEDATPVFLGTVPIPGGDCAKDKSKAHGAVASKYVVNVPGGANGGIPFFDSKFSLAALTLDKTWGNLNLVSTTGYFDQTQKALTVSDASPWATVWATDDHGYTVLNQELRLSSNFDGPFNFMIGGYYEDYKRGFWNAVDMFHVWNPVAQNYLSNILDSNTNGEYSSFFGHVKWQPSPRVELTAGARYSRDSKTTTFVNLVNGPSWQALYPQGQTLTARYSDSHVSPEATISFKPTEKTTLYAAYKTGYKSGGTSVPFLVYSHFNEDNMRFEPEEASGFEVGFKGDAFDRTLRYDLAAYSYDYDDLQLVSYNVDTISFTIGNAAKAKIEGLQGSFQWLAAEGLVLRGNFGLNNAKYTDYRTAQCYPGQTAATGCVGARQDMTGQRLLRAPKITYGLGGDYSPIIAEGWNTTFSLSGAYSDKFQTATDNAPSGRQEDYWIVNASIRVAPEAGRWEVALIGRNLTDSYYMLNSNGWTGASNNNQQIGWFNPPREVALQATLRF